MSEEIQKKDIRGLLKTFGVESDEAITRHIARHPHVKELHLKLTLEDITNYDETVEKLAVIVERKVQCCNK
ncbi:MAG: hypothetical protein VX544_04830 [Pseudomonadota bacterium]|nr:hypothetical protein [Pseudomonadota bacterium]|tara:strand:- start:665 stop:877 length:213 start_codon:yes stop_codon:yes gene_type:complete